MSFAVCSAILPAFGFGTFVSNGGQLGFCMNSKARYRACLAKQRRDEKQKTVWHLPGKRASACKKRVFGRFLSYIANAVAEKLNSKITTIQKRSCGFGNRDHFKIAAISIAAGLTCIWFQLLMEEPDETQWHS